MRRFSPYRPLGATALLLALSLAAAPPARAEKVQIDPAYNTVTCVSGCSGGGGGGGAVTAISGAFVDGWNVTGGAEADAACGTDTGTCTQMALLKRSLQRMTSLLAVFPTTLTLNSGAPDASTLRVVPAATGFNVAATPTIQNASYVSGNCMGGFQTVALGASSTVLSQVMLASKGGLVTAKQIYIFSASPASSTCTDKSTFTLNAADLSKLMTTFSLTPAAPTGTTVSQAAQSNMALGLPTSGTVYVAVVETATETPATTTDLVLNLNGL